MSSPRLIFIAGPNGAGKTTFYEAFLAPSGLPFVNADRLAAALGVTDTEAAAAADAARAQLVDERQSFITETVFSDPVGAKLGFLRAAITAGYQVTIYYIGIASPELSEARVFHRVQAGGHDVPSGRLERRLRQSLMNLQEAMRFVPEVHVFDNNSALHPFRLVLTVRKGEKVLVADPVPAWLAKALSEG